MSALAESSNCASEAFITNHFPSSSTAGHVATFADTGGNVLQDGGAPTGGTVTSITAGTGLTGGTITSAGTIAIDNGSVLWRTAATTDTIGNTDCLKTVELTGNTVFSETLPSVSGFPAGCKVKVKNGDSYSGPGTGRGRQLIGFPADVFNILYPGQVVEEQIINGVWVTTLNPGRWAIQGPTFYMNQTSGSNSGTADGLASGAGAFQTLNYALTVEYQHVDNQNASPTIYLDTAGNSGGVTLSECDTVQGQLVGINVGFIQGLGGTAVWNTSGACAALIIADNAEWELGALVVESTTSGGTGIQIHQTGVVDLITGFGCGAFSAGTCIASDHGGFINFDENGGNLPIGPGAIGTFLALGQGTQMVGSFTAQMQGNPTIGTWMTINGAGTNAILGSFSISGAYTSGTSTCKGPSAFTLGSSLPGGAPTATAGCQSL